MTNASWTKFLLAGLLAFRATGIAAMAGDDEKKESKVFEIDGRRIYYHDEGSGRPILILHGADLFIPGS